MKNRFVYRTTKHKHTKNTYEKLEKIFATELTTYIKYF